MKSTITVELDEEMARILGSEATARFPFPRYLVARVATRIGLRLLEECPEILDAEVEAWKQDKRKPRRSAKRDMRRLIIMAARRRSSCVE